MVSRTILLLCTIALAACKPNPTPQLYECSALNQEISCKELTGEVCARVDTGVRCIVPPCPSSELKIYADACSACNDKKVDLVFTGPCDLLQQRLESGKVEIP